MQAHTHSLSLSVFFLLPWMSHRSGCQFDYVRLCLWDRHEWRFHSLSCLVHCHAIGWSAVRNTGVPNVGEVCVLHEVCQGLTDPWQGWRTVTRHGWVKNLQRTQDGGQTLKNQDKFCVSRICHCLCTATMKCLGLSWNEVLSKCSSSLVVVAIVVAFNFQEVYIY